MDSSDASARQIEPWLRTVKFLGSHSADPLPTQRYFKVPPSLSSNNNADAYKPVMFKFGLWHGASTCFNDSSTLLFKLQAVRKFCSLAAESSPTLSPDSALNDFVQLLMTKDDQVRECYGSHVVTPTGLQPNENIVDREAAAYAMALDVITVYIATRSVSSEGIGFDPPCIRSVVRRDAVLVDNQLPLFAFRCLLRILHKCDHDDDEVVGKCQCLFQILEVYAYRNSPFRAGWVYRKPASVLESLLGCIYDGWMGKRSDDNVDTSRTRSRREWGAGMGCLRRRRNDGRDRTDLIEHATEVMHASSGRPPRSESDTLTSFQRRENSRGPELSYIDSAASDSAPPRALATNTAVLEITRHATDADPPQEASHTEFEESSLEFGLVSAAHLYRNGIRFKALKHPNKSRPLNLATCIRFDKDSGILTLPKITVVDGTQRFLLNLLAYEHTSRFNETCTLLSYVCIMDMLINSKEDVELLVEWGIVDNKLGSHAHLATMWNGLTVGYPFRLSPAHRKIVESVCRVSKRRWPRWRHGFREIYYERRPWLLVSTVAAMVLLILTALQTVYTMKADGLHHHHHK